MRSRRRYGPDRLRSRWLPGYWLRHPLTSLVVVAGGTAVFLALGLESAYHTYRLNTYGVRPRRPCWRCTASRGARTW